MPDCPCVAGWETELSGRAQKRMNCQACCVPFTPYRRSQSIPYLFPHSRSIILSNKVPFYYHTEQLRRRRRHRHEKTRKISLLAKERFCDFIRDVELSLPIHTFDHHLAMPVRSAYPIRFLSFSPPSRRLVPDVRVRFLLAFIVSCSAENDDLAQGDVNGIEIAVVLMLSRSPSARGCRGGGNRAGGPDGESNCAWRFNRTPIYHFVVFYRRK